MNVFELVATLKLNSSAFQQGLESAQKQASGFASGFSKLGKMAALAFGGAETAIVGFAKSSVSTGMQFDSAMSQVAATMGTTVDNIKNMRDFAKEMGRTTAFTAAQAAEGMNILAMAGYTAEQNMETLPAVLNMASAGGLSIAQAADYATGILAGFGLSMDQAGSVANKLSMIAKSAKGDVASFGEGLSTVAGMARTTGQNMDDMTVALGILGNNNYSASEAGNALSRTLRNLYQPSDSAAKMLAKLGVSAYDANGSTKPLQQVLLELNGALDGMDDASKNQVLSKIFDAATLKSVPALMNNAGQAWDDLSAKVKSADAQGTAGDMAKEQLNNLSGAMTIFQSAVDGAKLAISDKLTPTLTQFVKLGTDSISDLTSAFENGGIDGLMAKLPEVFGKISQEIIAQIPVIVKAGVQLLAGLGKGLVSAFPSLMTAVTDVINMATSEGMNILIDLLNNADGFADSASAAIRSFASGIEKKLPELVHTAVLMVNWMVKSIAQNSPKLLNAGIEVFRSIMSGFSNYNSDFSTIIPRIFENLGGAITSNLATLMQFGAEMLSNLASGMVEGIPMLLQTVLPILLELSGTFTENIGTLVDSGIQLLLGLVQGLMDGLPTLIAYVPQIITNLAVAINENMPKILMAGVQIIWTVITGLVQAIPALLSNMGNIMLMVIEVVQAINWLNLGQSILKFITQGVKSLATTLPTQLKNIAQRGWEMIKNHDWLGLGKAIIDGIVNGIKNFGSSIASALMEKASGAFNAVKNFFKIGSPSKLMEQEIGRWIPEGLAVGISANADSLYDTMHDLSEGTVDAYNPEIEPVSAGGRYGVQMDGVIAEIKSLKDAMMGMSLVLDTGATVGGLAPAMDAQLGTFAVYKGRGN